MIIFQQALNDFFPQVYQILKSGHKLNNILQPWTADIEALMVSLSVSFLSNVQSCMDGMQWNNLHIIMQYKYTQTLNTIK